MHRIKQRPYRKAEAWPDLRVADGYSKLFNGSHYVSLYFDQSFRALKKTRVLNYCSHSDVLYPEASRSAFTAAFAAVSSLHWGFTATVGYGTQGL